MRGLSLLLGACGVVAAGLLWRELAAGIAVPAGAASTTVRLAVTLLWLLPAAILLWAMLLVQMGARFLYGVVDPTAGQDGRLLQVNQRVITNTVEHGAVFVVAMLAAAAGLDGPHMPALLALALVFTVARIAFWAGYLVAPLGRTLGMAATLAATAAAIGWALLLWMRTASIG